MKEDKKRTILLNGAGIVLVDKILQVEYDAEYRIVHITADQAIRVETLEYGLQLAEEIKGILAEYLQGGQGYLIVDYGKIHIEARHVDKYAHFIRDLYDHFLYPDGLARYGMSISRVMANLSLRKGVNYPTNLFSTKGDAFHYIRKLAKIRMETVADG